MQAGEAEGRRVFGATVDGSGRIVLPAEVRAAFGLKKGSEVSVVQDETGVHLQTPQQALRAIQAYFQNLVPPEVSLADEVIQEHRDEAARERE
ncbi:SpoVT / AbrB like domain protein [Symmachiella dynata]|uniref:SpoVT / AbrB like domain protein n=1 Tax=Symmachiella dynata TaxID=2527995 RepID=A0A517ZRT4_9PLAN|nr:AbrB/MazE/SpoVT family DNA-binding domain-containing protein [Symmachiella dynata]QDU45202.1 SpoVT / AbrB like domain protein [Symmachiella dynata]